MGKISVDISVSLDGFIAGPDDGPQQPLGRGGERLHEWVYGLKSWRERHGLSGGTDDQDAEVLEEAFADVGAAVMGRRMFDLGEEPWGDDPPFHVPVFVVTHRPRDPLVKQGGTTFSFVTDGVDEAVQHAREAAGDRAVSVAGGADVVQQCLKARLVDDLQIHLVPVLLGAGRRLFDGLDGEDVELTSTRVVDSPGLTHLRFRVGK